MAAVQPKKQLVVKVLIGDDLRRLAFATPEEVSVERIETLMRERNPAWAADTTLVLHIADATPSTNDTPLTTDALRLLLSCSPVIRLSGTLQQRTLSTADPVAPVNVAETAAAAAAATATTTTASTTSSNHTKAAAAETEESATASVYNRLVENFEVRQEAVRDSLALLREMGFPDRPMLHTSLILLHSGNINQVVQSLFAVEASEEHTRKVIEGARCKSNAVFERLHTEAGKLTEQIGEQAGELGKVAGEQAARLGKDTRAAASELERQIGSAERCLRAQVQRYQQQAVERRACRQAVQRAASVRHAAMCDQCHKQIIGSRFKCLTCPDYDLCAHCEALPAVHDAMHLFVKISNPEQLAHNAARLQQLGLQCSPFVMAATAAAPSTAEASVEEVVEALVVQPAVEAATAPPTEPSLVERLQAMGFDDEEACRAALERTGGDLHRACILLLQ
mmetsp:Transcript_6288/g.19090  ORF Transcript_6288/g.19090 Transcript_6288/m.19090 type:complete len:452 (-) Transcript_6288:68-1423(-)